jgi:hypothetical protein
MNAIFQGRRCRVVHQAETTVSLEPRGASGARIQVAIEDPDLILDPTADDVALAEAFERGDIGAFEYVDGHTYPPNREIATPATRRRRSTVH